MKRVLLALTLLFAINLTAQEFSCNRASDCNCSEKEFRRDCGSFKKNCMKDKMCNSEKFKNGCNSKEQMCNSKDKSCNFKKEPLKQHKKQQKCQMSDDASCKVDLSNFQ